MKISWRDTYVDTGKETGEDLGICVYLCARRAIWGVIIFDICKDIGVGVGVDEDIYMQE